MKKIKFKNNKLRGLSFREVIVILFVFSVLLLSLFVINNIISKTRVNPHLSLVENGSLKKNYTFKGLILRPEVLVKTDDSGDLLPVAVEGAKVAKDDPILRVVTDTTGDLLDEIDRLNVQIASQRLEVINQSPNSEATKSFKESDISMQPVLELLRTEVGDGNLQALSSNLSTLNTIIRERNRKLDSLSFQDQILTSLQREKEVYETQLDSIAKTYIAPEAGIVSYHVDDLINDWNEDLIKRLSLSSFDDYYSKAGRMKAVPEKLGQDASVARVCTSSTQYFFLKIEQGKASDFNPVLDTDGNVISKVSPSISVDNEPGLAQDCEVISVKPVDDGVILLLKTTEQVENYLNLRKISGQLSLTRKTGLIIPGSALIYSDQGRSASADIYILHQGYVIKVPVRIVLLEGAQAIVEPSTDQGRDYLKEGSVIIINPNSVSEGARIG